MEWDLAHLRALDAAVAEGTFEAAARALHVTPSAVSQRLRALETATGQVLLVRSKPVRVTAAGEPVLRLARQIAVLGDETARALGADSSPDGSPALPALSVAVNADSLATWFLPAVAPLASEALLHLRREDEGRTAELLRDGSVVAAVTTVADPIAGCLVTRLGSMRYRPVATPEFIDRWFAGRSLADGLRSAPVVVFDQDDPLQHAFLARHAGQAGQAGRAGEAGRAGTAPQAHLIPSSADYTRAIAMGFGWGLLPELQLDAREGTSAAEALVRLPGADDHVDVALHWQHWRLRSPALDRLTEAVVTAARSSLRQ